jgi:hypothetical protein
MIGGDVRHPRLKAGHRFGSRCPSLQAGVLSNPELQRSTNGAPEAGRMLVTDR